VIAKWLLVVLFGLGLLFTFVSLGVLFQDTAQGVIAVVQVALQCVGVYMLFLPESVTYMQKK